MDSKALEYENQKLVQQLEVQKSEMHALEGKFKELRDEQCSYEKTLISLNKIWNQLIDDLVLLGVRAGGDLDNLQALDHEELSDESFESCPSEEIFLLRLLKASNFKNNNNNSLMEFVEEALAFRRSATVTLMKSLQEAISSHQARNESLTLAFNGQKSNEDVILALQNHNDHLKEVVENASQAISIINEKHKRYLDEIEAFKSNHSRELQEIKRISGELEESMAELEESQRKLVVLQLQKHGSVLDASSANAVNGGISTDKSSDKSMSWQDLKDAVDAAKTLSGNRLLELHQTQEDNLILSKELGDLEGQLKDENYVLVSKPYTILNDQLQHLNAEIERYRGLVEVLQNDKDQLMQKEKEICAKSESFDSIKQTITTYETKIEELENQIQIFTSEKNDLETKVEETLQDSGKKDFKNEIHVMAAALTNELGMMENQLSRSKDAASEAIALREQAESLTSLVAKKVCLRFNHSSCICIFFILPMSSCIILQRASIISNTCDENMLNFQIEDQKEISDKYNSQLIEIKSLKALVEELEKERQELQYIADMYTQECSDSRTIADIEESENRARNQAEYLRSSLEEHSLELRVKAASEAEAACQQRLSFAEAELEELRAKVDASERDVVELKEAIRIKEAEGDAYISDIETIGQAYEDMQTQNQHLRKQLADRDDFNIKLVSDSVKMKQASSSLLSEKLMLEKQLQQVNTSLESSKPKIARGEEQMKTCVAQAIKTSAENRHLTISLERTALDVSNAEKELKWLRSSVGSSEKEYEQTQQKISELRLLLEQERSERRRLEEQYEEVKNEVMELTSETEETTIQKLQDEIKECKAILKCGVCFDRPKEVVITKCFHLFCSPCIQRNLEIRHRKCPGCGTPFGQNDVREVKI
ncbi:E3 ubiquitin-protein ligase BRE1-like 2 [Dichanthelium oligosanthes]|uniref:E3 ubiquitin protein ligase n=1 Tax=Dichanthelium oligosanthes TaxID=888268 RepID=A0A1E5WBR6_9POAL|nr:E3 ubiquitin-protein ligase BRE1-like 2 [Dichanthelium oligosanthes]